MDIRIKNVLMEVRGICSKHQCGDGCPFEAEGSRRCLFGTTPPSDWDFPIVTPPERELLRLTGARYVSRDEHASLVDMWSEQPTKQHYGAFRAGGTHIGVLIRDLMPSIPSGTCMDVAALLGEGSVDGAHPPAV